eukprot:SM000180S03486  [mRNA]  locus=s180:69046:76673:- [translate_table: standard]
MPRRVAASLGPACLVSLGFLSPAAWAAIVEEGPRFGLDLLWVLLASNAVAVGLQLLAARLGLVTGKTLAEVAFRSLSPLPLPSSFLPSHTSFQMCREEYPWPVPVLLWASCEVAIVALDCMMVLGAAIGLKLLFNVPMLAGVLIMELEPILTVALPHNLLTVRFSVKAGATALVIITMCFVNQLVRTGSPFLELDSDFSVLVQQDRVWTAMAFLGLNVLPQNLHLHSFLPQAPLEKYSLVSKLYVQNAVDICLSLGVGLLANAAALGISSTTFYAGGSEPSNGFFNQVWGSTLAPAFGVALATIGIISYLTQALSGQVVSKGFIGMQSKPWLRRSLVRTAGVILACTSLISLGGVDRMLQLCQVVMSLQLPLTLIPLIKVTSSKVYMGPFQISRLAAMAAWTVGIIIYVTNIIVLFENIVYDDGSSLSGDLRSNQVVWAILAGSVLAGEFVLAAWMAASPLRHTVGTQQQGSLESNSEDQAFVLKAVSRKEAMPDNKEESGLRLRGPRAAIGLRGEQTSFDAHQGAEEPSTGKPVELVVPKEVQEEPPLLVPALNGDMQAGHGCFDVSSDRPIQSLPAAAGGAPCSQRTLAETAQPVARPEVPVGQLETGTAPDQEALCGDQVLAGDMQAVHGAFDVSSDRPIQSLPAAAGGAPCSQRTLAETAQPVARPEVPVGQLETGTAPDQEGLHGDQVLAGSGSIGIGSSELLELKAPQQVQDSASASLPGAIDRGALDDACKPRSLEEGPLGHGRDRLPDVLRAPSKAIEDHVDGLPAAIQQHDIADVQKAKLVIVDKPQEKTRASEDQPSMGVDETVVQGEGLEQAKSRSAALHEPEHETSMSLLDVLISEAHKYGQIKEWVLSSALKRHSRKESMEQEGHLDAGLADALELHVEVPVPAASDEQHYDMSSAEEKVTAAEELKQSPPVEVMAVSPSGWPSPSSTTSESQEPSAASVVDSSLFPPEQDVPQGARKSDKLSCSAPAWVPSVPSASAHFVTSDEVELHDTEMDADVDLEGSGNWSSAVAGVLSEDPTSPPRAGTSAAIMQTGSAVKSQPSWSVQPVAERERLAPEGALDPGSLSRLSGLGRGARRQLAAVLDEFWGIIFDLHGQPVAANSGGSGGQQHHLALGRVGVKGGNGRAGAQLVPQDQQNMAGMPGLAAYKHSGEKPSAAGFSGAFGRQAPHTISASTLRQFASVSRLPQSDRRGHHHHAAGENGSLSVPNLFSLPGYPGSGDAIAALDRGQGAEVPTYQLQRRATSITSTRMGLDIGSHSYGDSNINLHDIPRDAQLSYSRGSIGSPGSMAMYGKSYTVGANSRQFDNDVEYAIEARARRQVQELMEAYLPFSNRATPMSSVVEPPARSYHQDKGRSSFERERLQGDGSWDGGALSGHLGYHECLSESDPMRSFQADSVKGSAGGYNPEMEQQAVDARAHASRQAPGSHDWCDSEGAARPGYGNLAGGPLSFDDLAPSQQMRDAFSLQHPSSSAELKSFWSKQPHETLFGPTHDQGQATSTWSQPAGAQHELDNQEKDELLMRQLRSCLHQLLKIEGSSWLFRYECGADEDVVAAVVDQERKLYQEAVHLVVNGQMSSREDKGLTTLSFHKKPKASSDSIGGKDALPVLSPAQQALAMEAVLLAASMWGCGEACLWSPSLLVNFGVWCVHRVLKLAQMESRPELWGKYTYVLNRLQGILDPAFSKPRTVPALCKCFGDKVGQDAVCAQQWGSQHALAQSMAVGSFRQGGATPATSLPYSRSKGPPASVFLDIVKEVETAVGARKGRTGTAAGDVAFPKGKENLASVLKRYKRRLGNKQPGGSLTTMTACASGTGPPQRRGQQHQSWVRV